MASPAWFAGFMAAFAPSSRYENLFSKTDLELAACGFDRDGLQRSHVAGIGYL